MLLKISQYIILFLYIYSIQFIGLPFGIGTRVVLAILGLCLFFLNIKKKLSFNSDFLKLMFILILLSLVSLFSTLVNITNDYQFVGYSFSLLLIFLASYFTFNFFLIKKEVSSNNYFKVISEGIIYIVLIQSFLAFVMFFYSPVADFLNSIQVFIDLDKDKLEEALELRLVGFGIKFFAFGIVNGYALILLASLLKKENYTPSKRVFLWLTYFVIFLIGMMAARTTVIGFCLSMLLYFNPFQKKIKIKTKDKWKLIAYFILLLFLVYFVNISLFHSDNSKFNQLFDFGFDLFINFFETGNANSASLNQMNEMYIWPTELETYVIGDGRFMGVGSDYYYKGTDIGWIRLLYYFGIPGTVIYFITHYFIIRKSIKRYPIYKVTFWMLLIYFFILNFKGFSDIIFLIIPFLLTINIKNKSLNEVQR
ncbi:MULTISPECIES: hypothetical protein [unclassified Empedobacter]|uniref:hypothetical protein n=1 Tax=unclassified Empedobacter TaxID=2643773 RepID=UPI0025C473E4|nr:MULTISPECIES: hypothetical protein [unclassified Empedobacter]